MLMKLTLFVSCFDSIFSQRTLLFARTKQEKASLFHVKNYTLILLFWLDFFIVMSVGELIKKWQS
ncbi:hypothetical protein A0U91_15465 (plasmid) [Acetobacter persici]|uniref:Uncharacterized protein n=1 Tax=Acetobacter persici TaxID=1076596 RepID=A0A1U9LJ10_9PROT|nr:hypothetical protein A0U91_15465 [Acetobacter persici]